MAGKKKRDGEVALKVFYHQRRMEECLNHHKALQNINSFLYSDGHVKLDFVIRGSLRPAGSPGGGEGHRQGLPPTIPKGLPCPLGWPDLLLDQPALP